MITYLGHFMNTVIINTHFLISINKQNALVTPFN